MRFRFIEDRRADYPVTIMCNVLGVSPAGYAWHARPESPQPCLGLSRIASLNSDRVIGLKSAHKSGQVRA